MKTMRLTSRSILTAAALLISAGASPALASDVVTVRRGDSLSVIAQQHGVTVAQLRALNNLKGNLIRPGQQLRLRAAAKTSTPANIAALPAVQPRAVNVAAVSATARTVTVRAGDSLSLLAQRHGVTVARLQTLNNLKGTVIHVGQVLKISETTVTAPARPKGPSVKLVRGRVLGVPVTAIEVDLRDPLVFVTPVLPPRGLGTGMVFDRAARTSGAAAFVNGGYFHPTSYVPAGDLVVRGRFLASGRAQVALAMTSDNRVRVHAVQEVRPAAWRGFETVIATGPQIVRGGNVSARPYSDGHRDGAIFQRAARSAVGIRNDRSLVFMSTQQPLTMAETAKIMQRFGAREAILLDGGSSTGMAWKGKTLVRPARMISYGIGVFINYRGQRYTR